MTCEICDTATATMWVEKPLPDSVAFPLAERAKTWLVPQPIPSCDDCGPQAGYKILAPLEPSSTLKR